MTSWYKYLLARRQALNELAEKERERDRIKARLGEIEDIFHEKTVDGSATEDEVYRYHETKSSRDAKGDAANRSVKKAEFAVRKIESDWLLGRLNSLDVPPPDEPDHYESLLSERALNQRGRNAVRSLIFQRTWDKWRVPVYVVGGVLGITLTVLTFVERISGTP